MRHNEIEDEVDMEGADDNTECYESDSLEEEDGESWRRKMKMTKLVLPFNMRKMLSLYMPISLHVMAEISALYQNDNDTIVEEEDN